MKTFRSLSLFVIFALLLVSFASVHLPVEAQVSTQEIGPDTLYVPGEVIVAFAEGQSAQAYLAQASALAGEVGAQVVEVFQNLALLQFDESADMQALVAQLSSGQGVAYAEPNYVRWIPEMQMDPASVVGHLPPRTEVTFHLRDAEGSGTREITLSLRELRSMKSIRTMNRNRKGAAIPTWPTDPQLWTQWGWNYSDAAIIWPDKALNPAVCVVDTGVDNKHPDLAGRVLAGYDFVNDDAKPDDDNGHGTHVAGTISARINNGKGFAGISTARIVPVKVLTAQGWGTAFDIAKGIMYCADRTDVKVINLSLGGAVPSEDEYNALDYAINAKGKLVVAAAGNSSMAYQDWNGNNAITPGTDDKPASFPAGWAVAWVCKDGTLAPGAPSTADCASGNENSLAPGLISVAAASSLDFDYSFDTDGDGLIWVDQDGDSTPNEGLFDAHFCSASFSNYGAWVEIIAPGKDIYSTVPVSYNYYDKYFWGADGDGDGYDSWSGTSMAAPHVAGAVARVWSVFPTYTNTQIEDALTSVSMFWPEAAMDPNMAQPWMGYYDANYGGEAPFCWPDDTHGPLYDMSNVPYLDVAGAMDRTALWQPVSDAITGLPLEKAVVMAYAGATLKDSAIVSRENGWVSLINLPASLGYTIKVSKSGYTAGAVDVYPGLVWLAGPGYGGGDLPTLAIPPIGRITAVVNWSDGDLDLYTWLPASNKGVVGPGGSGSPDDRGPGLFSDFPRARWNRDGGYYDWLGAESVSIVPKPGAPTTPYYNLAPGDFYAFFVTDYGLGDLNQDLTFYLWAGGKIVPNSFIMKSNSCNLGEDWWYAGRISGSTFTPVDDCGDSSNWPY